jgi:LacI family transcriptional regulator
MKTFTFVADMEQGRVCARVGTGMTATIKDVAREAGVSVASVSRALNGHSTVIESKRRHILDVARRLRYVPHGAARSLITRRTQTIGILLPDMHGEFFSELIRGIDSEARERGLHILVSSSHGDADEAVAALAAMRGRVDGLLVMSPHVDPRFLDEHFSIAIPTVLMNTRGGNARVPTLTIDNYGGAYAVTKHLLDGGRRRIALITGPDGNFDAVERLRGYRAALAELAPSAREWIVPGNFSEEAGYRAGRNLLGKDERPDAIFASNDMMAIGCLFALQEAGVHVPSDIALAGFDDIPIARYVTPPLTTVRVSIDRLGHDAMETLAQMIEKADPAEAGGSRVLPFELIIRASCGGQTP